MLDYHARMLVDSNQPPQPDTVIRDRFPRLDESSVPEAEENLRGYAELALRIYDRIVLDTEAYAPFRALTASEPGSTMGPASVEGHNQDHAKT